MRFEPKRASRCCRGNAGLLPPCCFVATAVDLAMWPRHSGTNKLVADPVHRKGCGRKPNKPSCQHSGRGPGREPGAAQAGPARFCQSPWLAIASPADPVASQVALAAAWLSLLSELKARRSGLEGFLDALSIGGR
jgi:hypothetical protein